MRHLRSSTNFDIIFSLFVSEPHVLDVKWNIEDAINGKLHLSVTKLKLFLLQNIIKHSHEYPIFKTMQIIIVNIIGI